MMEISYEKERNGNYMRIRERDLQKKDVFAEKILTHNTLPWLLPISFETLNEERMTMFDLTGKKTFSGILEQGELSLPLLQRLFQAVQRVSDVLSEYLLPLDGLLLEPQWIFLDAKQQFYFCYLPGNCQELQGQLQKVMDAVITQMPYQDPQLVKFAFDLYQILQNEHFSLSLLGQQMHGPEQESDVELTPFFSEQREEETAWVDPFLAADRETPKEEGPEPLLFEKVKQYWKGKRGDPMQIPRDLAFAEGTSGKVPGTGIFLKKAWTEPSEKEPETLVGVRQQEGVVIPLTKYPFLIGKRKGEVDFCLLDAAVSRIHARILRDAEGTLFLEDLNSTNGTRKNGVKLEPYIRMPMQSGDLISFADQEFLVH